MAGPPWHSNILSNLNVGDSALPPEQASAEVGSSGEPEPPTPWSKAEVLERLGEDEDLLREMCGIFLNESARLLDKLRQAVAEHSPDAVMRVAHSLKGEVSYFSAPAATAAARRMEDMGHEGDISQAPDALIVLERELAFLCRSVRAFAETGE